MSNHKKWHSHDRMIGIKTLTDDLRLRIEDYTDNEKLKLVIRRYSDLRLDCVQSRRVDYMFHIMAFSNKNKNDV